MSLLSKQKQQPLGSQMLKAKVLPPLMPMRQAQARQMQVLQLRAARLALQAQARQPEVAVH